jgi:Amt family ammonium transporter
MMVTMIAGCTGGIVGAFTKPFIMGTYSKKNRYDVGALTNGILAGLVSVTGVCDRCEPWSALVIGALGGAIYVLCCKLAKRIKLDDPAEAAQVHGSCGIWGTICVGIFDNQKGLVS